MKQNFFEDYYQELNTAFEGGRPSIRYNSDRAHNAVVMCFMFNHAEEVNMYCGQMSVLRSSFFKKINEENNLGDQNLGNRLKQHLKDSLEKFLHQENAKLNILFESYSEKYADDLVSRDVMKEALAKNKLSMKALPDGLSSKKALDHFCVTDTLMYRFEDDKDQHSAICAFNNEKYTSILKQNFEILFSLDGNQKITLD